MSGNAESVSVVFRSNVYLSFHDFIWTASITQYLASLLEKSFDTTSAGVTVLSRMLYNIDPQACTEGVRMAGSRMLGGTVTASSAAVVGGGGGSSSSSAKFKPERKQKSAGTRSACVNG